MPFIEQVNEGSGVGYIKFSTETGWSASDGNEGENLLQINSSPVVMDVINHVQGWLQIETGIRDWQPYSIPPQQKPSEKHKIGYQCMFYSKKHFGEADPFREMTTNQYASKTLIKEVYNAAEAMWIAQGNDPQTKPFSQSGMSAVVLINPDVTPIKIGAGRSVKISFTLQKLIPMPSETDAPAQPAPAPAPQPVAAPPVSARQAATAPTPPPASNDVDFSNISADEI